MLLRKGHVCASSYGNKGGVGMNRDECGVERSEGSRNYPEAGLKQPQVKII